MTKPPSEPIGIASAKVAELDVALQRLDASKTRWPAASTTERIALLKRVRAGVLDQAETWVDVALKLKALPVDSPLAGEEWSSGPWVMLTTVDLLLETLSQADNPLFVEGFPTRTTRSDQLAVEVFPRTLFDRLLMSGVTAEVWMEPGVDQAGLASTMGRQACSSAALEGKLSLVLGAGNISSIAPLDALHKLFTDDSVVLLKLNPVMDPLADVFVQIMAPMTAAGVLEIVSGGADVGAYLTGHPMIETIHITGSGLSHDAIVFGPGADGAARRAEASPLNIRPITSELGGVSPTIVVPGRWSAADLRFQAEHVATQKLHNSGFNCVATQVLILPADWDQVDAFEHKLRLAVDLIPVRGQDQHLGGDAVEA